MALQQHQLSQQMMPILMNRSIPCATCKHVVELKTSHPNFAHYQCHRWGPIKKMMNHVLFGDPEQIPICNTWEGREEKE